MLLINTFLTITSFLYTQLLFDLYCGSFKFNKIGDCMSFYFLNYFLTPTYIIEPVLQALNQVSWLLHSRRTGVLMQMLSTGQVIAAPGVVTNLFGEADNRLTRTCHILLGSSKEAGYAS